MYNSSGPLSWPQEFSADGLMKAAYNLLLLDPKMLMSIHSPGPASSGLMPLTVVVRVIDSRPVARAETQSVLDSGKPGAKGMAPPTGTAGNVSGTSRKKK